MGPEAWLCGPQVSSNDPMTLSLSELRGLGCRVEADWGPAEGPGTASSEPRVHQESNPEIPAFPGEEN